MIILGAAVGSEDLPVAHTQSAKDCVPFLTAKAGICIHRGHENGGILVVFCLLGGEPVDVDVHITGESNMVLIIDQDNFPREMSAISFINFK